MNATIVEHFTLIISEEVAHVDGMRVVTISEFASNASRRVVGQWRGAGGASCEDHLAFCGELLGCAAGKKSA